MRWEGLELTSSGTLNGTGLTGRGIAIPATWKVVCRDTGKEKRSLRCLGARSTGRKWLSQSLELGCECWKARTYLQGYGDSLLGEHGCSQGQVLDLAARRDGELSCKPSRGMLRKRRGAVPQVGAGKHLGFPSKETGKESRAEGAGPRGDDGGGAAVAGFLLQGGSPSHLVTGSKMSPEALSL